MLNLDPWNILFTVINLLVFFCIIKFFLLKPIKKVMDQREKMIQDDLNNAQLEYDKTMSKLESEIAGLALVAATKVVKGQSSNSDTSSYDEFLGEEDK